MLSSVHRFAAQHSGRDAPHGEFEAQRSFLGPGVRVRGVLEVNGELVVSGLVRGRVSAVRLVVAAGGYVEGDIVGLEVVIAGRLKGRIFSPTVLIEADAEIEGRIFHTNITVARGAHIEGRMPWRPPSYFENLKKLPEIRP